MLRLCGVSYRYGGLLAVKGVEVRARPGNHGWPRLSCRFTGPGALEDVDLHVRRGDAYGLLGHNGAGKTTAMRLATGLRAPHTGRVLIDGFDIRRHPREARARVGALIESAGFFPTWSGRANLRAFARLQGLRAAELKAAVEEALETTGLLSAAGRAVRGYSQGMRQRLGIAQALVGSPDLVILDEPTNGLDPEGIADISALIRRLTRDEGRTVLVSSHRLHEVAEICNRVGVIKEGRMLLEQEVATLFDSTGAPYRIRSADDSVAATVLESMGLLPAVAPGGGLLVDLGVEVSDSVLRRLFDSGVRVSSFAPRETSLQEIYLRIEKGTSGPESPEDVVAGPVSTVKEPLPTFARRGPMRAICGALLPIARIMRYDLRRHCRSLALPAILFLPGLLGALKVGLLASGEGQSAEEVEAGTLFSATHSTAYSAFGTALVAGLPVLIILAVLLLSQSISGEAGRGTLRTLLLRPVSRWQLAVGKALASMIVVIIAWISFVGLALAAAAWWFDFGDLVDVLPNGETFPLLEGALVRPELDRVVVRPLAALLGIAMVGFFVGSLIRSPVAALATSLGAWLALDFSRPWLRQWGREAGDALAREAWTPATFLPSPFGERLSLVYYYEHFAAGEGNVQYLLEGPDIRVPLFWVLGTVAASILLVRWRSVS